MRPWPLTRAKIKLRLAMVALDGAMAAGGSVRRGLTNLAAAFVAEATAEISKYPGASGTARKAPGAAPSGAAARRTARAPQSEAARSSPDEGFDRAGGPETAILRPSRRQRGGEAGSFPSDSAAKIGNGAAVSAEAS